MSYKHVCIIDANGIYREYALMFGDTVIGYDVVDGEKIVDALSPVGSYCIAKWNGEGWTEMATGIELESWKQLMCQPL